MKELKQSLIAFTILLASGCGGTGSSGNPSDPANLDGDPAPTSISFQAVEGSGAVALTTSDAAGTPIEVTTAWVNIGEIEIELPEGLTCDAVTDPLPESATCECEMEGDETETECEITFAGNILFDLLTGVSTPAIGTFSMPSGIVKEIEVEIEDLPEDATLPEGAPSALPGHSLVVEGTATLDGTPTPFSLRLDFTEEIEFENLSGLEISEAVALNQILLTFNVDSWLAGIDLAACVAEGDVAVVDGTIIIDEESTSGDCSDIENVIKDNIEASGTLEEDDDEGDDL
jgi:hypothetical protein